MRSIQREMAMAKTDDTNAPSPDPDEGRVLQPDEALVLAKIQRDLAVASPDFSPAVHAVDAGGTSPYWCEAVSRESPASLLGRQQ